MSLATPAFAAPFTNGGFESPDISPNAFLVFTPTGWTLAGGTGSSAPVVILRAPTFTVSEGSQALDLSGFSTTGTTAGGVQQTFDINTGVQYQLQYDWTSKCAGSNVRSYIDEVADLQTNATATYPIYTTVTRPFIPSGGGTPGLVTIRFDTTTPGPTTASGTICGTIIDNVRITQAVTPTPGAAAGTQCSGATGHRVQFRKSSTTVNSLTTADAVYNRDLSDATIIGAASDNGIAYINYQDDITNVLSFNAFPSSPSRDVATPPLTVTKAPGLSTSADDNFVMRSSGYIFFPAAGTWNMSVASDDGFRLLMGQPAVLVSSFSGSRTIAFSAQPTTAAVTIAAPGCVHYELEWYNNTSGAGRGAAAFYANGPAPYSFDAPLGDTIRGGLAVYQGTDSPLLCSIVRVQRAPNSANGSTDNMDAQASDLDGLGGIYNIAATNATVGPVPPTWTPGVSGPIIIRATKTLPSSPAAFSFTVSDWNGNTKLCT